MYNYRGQIVSADLALLMDRWSDKCDLMYSTNIWDVGMAQATQNKVRMILRGMTQSYLLSTHWILQINHMLMWLWDVYSRRLGSYRNRCQV